MESHSTRVYKDLCERPELTTRELLIVYQHHERLDGNGYPVEVPNADIHPWAKLVAVIDVFDVMAGKRPYRRLITADHKVLKSVGEAEESKLRTAERLDRPDYVSSAGGCSG